MVWVCVSISNLEKSWNRASKQRSDRALFVFDEQNIRPTFVKHSMSDVNIALKTVNCIERRD